ncbi:MAG: 16S rRNA (adenine(1518)-N(6)/adenine(1519)-N(6))-dimethyltransferase RsmA [Opitutales bacterium]|nr:16S rRNA (adenine(1518)-N(6)/adenine(1519)-N(6))-dimethyltransferase RsmA [Opitutales bacterium]
MFRRMGAAVALAPLTRTATRQLLGQLDKRPSKWRGQNFLVDPKVVWRSVSLADVHLEDSVVEIGPGLGTLTRALLSRGCTVDAIEVDTMLYDYLRDTFAEIPQFHLTQGDAVRFPYAGFAGNRPFKVVANLPYSISTPWLDAALSQEILPETMTLMLQREAAQRLTAPTGTKHFAAISLMLSALYRLVAMVPVARTSFEPPPKVDSVILHLQKLEHGWRFSEPMRTLVRQIFTQRRKQLVSILRNLDKTFIPVAEDLLRCHGEPITARPEALSLPFWQAFDHRIQYTKESRPINEVPRREKD